MMPDLTHPATKPIASGVDDDSASEAARARVVAFAAAVGRTAQTAKLYEVNHPLVVRLSDAACDALRQACGDAAELRLGVGPDALYDGAARFDQPAEVADLAQAWHALDLGHVDFARSLDGPTLRKAIAIWLWPEGRADAELCEAVAASTKRAVRSEPVNYGRLRTSESAEAGGRSNWSWRCLFDEAFDAEADAPRWEAALERITHALHEEVRASAEDALQNLHREAHAALSDATSAPDASRGVARTTVHRLGRMLESLSPALRERLLAAAPTADSSQALKPAPSTEQDFAAVFEAVNRLDGRLADATRESLLMCQKLAGIASLMQGPDAPAQGPGDDASLVASLEELLDLHAPTDFTPDAYRQRLSEIASGTGPATALTDRIGSAFDPKVVGKHAFDLALHIASAGDDEPGPEAWQYLRRRVDGMVKQSDITPIAHATRAAESRLARGGPEETLIQCRTLLEELRASLCHDGRLGDLLDRVREPEDAATLLRHADPLVLHEAVRRLADTPDEHAAAMLAQPLRNMGGVLNAIVESLIAELPARRVALVQRLSPMSFATATRWLGPLLTQKDAPQRAKAFSLLSAAAPVWPADAAEGLLQHPDEAVRAAALQRLLHQVDPASLAAVGRLLTGKSTGRVPGEALVDRAVRSLLQQRTLGHAVLRDVLHECGHLRWGKRRQTLDPIIAAIRRHADPASASTILPGPKGAAS